MVLGYGDIVVTLTGKYPEGGRGVPRDWSYSPRIWRPLFKVNTYRAIVRGGGAGGLPGFRASYGPRIWRHSNHTDRAIFIGGQGGS